MLTDLLVFSKDLRLNLYSTRYGRCSRSASTPASRRPRTAGVAIRLGGATLELALDKLKMKQAFVNLLRNAIEASPIGGTVVIDVGQRDGGATIAVIDQGPGIAAADREAVFAPFFTTKERGTGLGLAIARQFTEAHGGRLWIEGTASDSATRFVTWLPLEARGG